MHNKQKEADAILQRAFEAATELAGPDYLLQRLCMVVALELEIRKLSAEQLLGPFRAPARLALSRKSRPR